MTNIGFSQILILLAVVMFAGAAIAVRTTGHWAWLVPAGLAMFAGAHLALPILRRPRA